MLDLQPFLEKYFTLKDTLILACSTGPDSTYLLHAILNTSYKKNLIVCYFDHKLRKEVELEKEFLKKLSIKYGFTLEIEECHIKKLQKQSPSISVEELGRKKRYEFLEKIREKYHAPYIITAHHLDDKIETFFFNLLRGSKLTWLINMTEKSGKILRPLINIEKKDIVSELKSKKVRYMIDATNSDIKISRNYMRLQILPLLEEINSSYKKNIQNFISYLETTKSYVDGEIQTFLDGKNFFSIFAFLWLSEFMQKEVIRYIYYTCNGNSNIWLTEANINEVIKFIKWKNNKTKKDIKKMKLYKENNTIYFL